MTKSQAKKKYKKWTPKSFDEKCKQITDSIVEGISTSGKWIKYWTDAELGGLPSNYSTKKEYHGLNVMCCLGRMYAKGYKHNKWVTSLGAKSLGGHVKKGESGLLLSYYEIKLYDEDGKVIPRNNPEKIEVASRRPFFNTFFVFNIEQCEGIEMPKVVKVKKRTFKPIKELDVMVEKYQLKCPTLTIEEKESNRAYYVPSRDHIVLPTITQFVERAEELKMTTLEGKHNHGRVKLHELGHSLKKRTLKKDEDMIPDFFFRNHEKDYAFEELCAELFSVFMGMKLGITYGHNLDNSETYLKGWCKALKSNPTWIVKASSDAMRRVKFFEECNNA